MRARSGGSTSLSSWRRDQASRVSSCARRSRSRPSTRCSTSAFSSSSVNSSSWMTALGRLALEDVDQLGTGEGGVEVEHVGAELGDRDGGVDEPAVVAAHHGDRVALADAELGQAARERVAAPVDLAEGELAELVDERRSGRGRSAPAWRSRRPGRCPTASGRGRCRRSLRGESGRMTPAPPEHAQGDRRRSTDVLSSAWCPDERVTTRRVTRVSSASQGGSPPSPC